MGKGVMVTGWRILILSYTFTIFLWVQKYESKAKYNKNIHNKTISNLKNDNLEWCDILIIGGHGSSLFKMESYRNTKNLQLISCK